MLGRGDVELALEERAESVTVAPTFRSGFVSAVPCPTRNRRARRFSSASARACASSLVCGTVFATESLRSPKADESRLGPLSPPESSPLTTESSADSFTALFPETSQPLTSMLVACNARSAMTRNSRSSLP